MAAVDHAARDWLTVPAALGIPASHRFAVEGLVALAAAAETPAAKLAETPAAKLAEAKFAQLAAAKFAVAAVGNLAVAAAQVAVAAAPGNSAVRHARSARKSVQVGPLLVQVRLVVQVPTAMSVFPLAAAAAAKIASSAADPDAAEPAATSIHGWGRPHPSQADAPRPR